MNQRQRVLRISPDFVAPTPPLTTLGERLRALAGHDSCREIGERTRTHPETVRRYLVGGKPSVEFVRAFADAYGVCADWLLFGTGAVRRRDQLETVLKEATLGQLMRSLSDRFALIEETLQAHSTSRRHVTRSLPPAGAAAGGAKKGRHTDAESTSRSITG